MNIGLFQSPYPLSTQASKYPEKLWPLSQPTPENPIMDTPGYSEVAKSVQSLFHQPAVSWIGKVFDWFFDPRTDEVASLKERNILVKKPYRAKNVLSASRVHQKALTSLLLELQEKDKTQFDLQDLKRSAGFPEHLNHRLNRKRRDTSDIFFKDSIDCQIKHIGNDSMDGRCSFSLCSCPGDLGYCPSASWSMSFNFPLDGLASKSNDPEQCKTSLTNCWNYRVIHSYANVADDYGSNAQCVTTPGVVTQAVDLFVFNWSLDIKNEEVIFQGQNETLILPSSSGNNCYTNNLIQETNAQPNPVIEYSSGLQCATGSYNVLYFDSFCTRRYVLESFILTLPNIVNGHFDYEYDFSNFCVCSVTAMESYFNGVENGSWNFCGDLSLSTTLNVTLVEGGFVLIQSPSGMVPSQMGDMGFILISNLENAIQDCYIQALSMESTDSAESNTRSYIFVELVLIPSMFVLGGVALYLQMLLFKELCKDIKEKQAEEELDSELAGLYPVE